MPEPVTMVVIAYEIAKFIGGEAGKTMIRPYLAKGAQMMGLVPQVPGSDISRRISALENQISKIQSHLEQEKITSFYSGWTILRDFNRSKDLSTISHVIARFHDTTSIPVMGNTGEWNNRDLRCLAFFGIAKCHEINKSDISLLKEYIQKCFVANPPLAVKLLGIKPDNSDLRSLLKKMNDIQKLMNAQDNLANLYYYLLDKTAEGNIVGNAEMGFPKRNNHDEKGIFTKIKPTISRVAAQPSLPIVILTLNMWDEVVIFKTNKRTWYFSFPPPSHLEETSFQENANIQLMSCSKYDYNTLSSDAKNVLATIHCDHFFKDTANYSQITLSFNEPLWKTEWNIRFNVNLKNFFAVNR